MKLGRRSVKGFSVEVRVIDVDLTGNLDTSGSQNDSHDTQSQRQDTQQSQQPVAKVPAEQDAGFANFDDDIPF